MKKGFPVDSDGKESAYNARDSGLIPGVGRSPGEGNGTPLVWSSCNLLLPPGWAQRLLRLQVGRAEGGFGQADIKWRQC